jgi:hypothetical protein
LRQADHYEAPSFPWRAPRLARTTRRSVWNAAKAPGPERTSGAFSVSGPELLVHWIGVVFNVHRRFPVIQVMCERCKSQKIVSKRVNFDGSARALCPDCLHAFSRWLHGASTFGSYPREEAGVRT